MEIIRGNRYLADLLEVSGVAPLFRWNETDGAADEKLWDAIATGSDLLFRTRTDLDGAGVTWLTVNRGTGTAVTNIQFGAPILNPDGTAAAPSVANITYTTSGLYWSAGPVLNVGTDGSFRASFSGTAFNLNIPITLAADNTHDLFSSSNRGRTGYFGTRVSVGLATNASGNIYAQDNAQAQIFSETNATSATAAYFTGLKTRGSAASRSDVANADNIVSFLGQVWSGGTIFSTAEMRYVVDGTFTSSQRPPSRIEFYTNASNSAQTLALTLNSSQNAIFAGFVQQTNAQKRVTAQVNKAASTTFSNLTDLTVTLTAGATYRFEITLYGTADQVGGYKFDLDGGMATATAIQGFAVAFDEDTVQTDVVASLAGDLAYNPGITGDAFLVRITGTITVNAGGTFIPRFAQNNATGTSSIYAGSDISVSLLN